MRDESIEELPQEIRDRALIFLRELLSTEEAREDIQDKMINQDKHNVKVGDMVIPYVFHFREGMWIRNELRQNVARDDELPSQNWDDYYMPLLEMVLEPPTATLTVKYQGIKGENYSDHIPTHIQPLRSTEDWTKLPTVIRYEFS